MWTHTLQVTHRNWVAEYQLGRALQSQGQLDEAMQHFYRAAADMTRRDIPVNLSMPEASSSAGVRGKPSNTTKRCSRFCATRSRGRRYSAIWPAPTRPWTITSMPSHVSRRRLALLSAPPSIGKETGGATSAGSSGATFASGSPATAARRPVGEGWIVTADKLDWLAGRAELSDTPAPAGTKC